jgi:hypothetical protein
MLFGKFQVEYPIAMSNTSFLKIGTEINKKEAAWI